MMGKVPYFRFWQKCTILVYDGKKVLYQSMIGKLFDRKYAFYQFDGKSALYNSMIGKLLFDGKHVLYQFMMGGMPYTSLWRGGGCYTSPMRKMICTSLWWLACPIPVNDKEKVPCIRLWWEKCPVPVYDGFSSDFPIVWLSVMSSVTLLRNH